MATPRRVPKHAPPSSDNDVIARARAVVAEDIGSTGCQPLSDQALYARAAALIADMKEAGATFCVRQPKDGPVTLAIATDIDGPFDVDRIDVMKRRLHARPDLYRAVLTLTAQRDGLVAAPFVNRVI